VLYEINQNVIVDKETSVVGSIKFIMSMVQMLAMMAVVGCIMKKFIDITSVFPASCLETKKGQCGECESCFGNRCK